MTQIFNFQAPEGFNGEKKEFIRDPWQDLYAARQNRTILQGVPIAIEEHQLNGENILCATVMMDGVKCIMPYQESALKDTGKKKENRTRLRKLIARRIAFIVIGLDRESNLAIISRKAAKDRMAHAFWKTGKEGKIVTVVAQEVFNNAVIVDVGGVEVEIPAKELSYGWVHDVRDLIQVGEAFDAKITYFDEKSEKVNLSVKALLPNPFTECLNRYLIGNEYLGKVSGIAEFGIFVNLEPGVDAVIPHFPKRKVKFGDQVLVKITKIFPEEQKITAKGIRVF
ncbi:MAG: S1 RNA-binding domain-containing protein [Tepidibacillus sp.]